MRGAIFLCLFVVLGFWHSSGVGSTGKTYDVVIVGGGIAGLTAAYFLNDEYDVLLLEMQDQVGGRASSGQYRSISFARGAEYLGKPDEPLKEIIEELDLTPIRIAPPADVVSHGGKLYFGELGKARLLISRSSLSDFNRFVRRLGAIYEQYDEIPELSLQGELARLDTFSAAQWFVENDFPPAYAQIYNVSARGLFGVGLGDISALSVIPEFGFEFEGYEEVADEDELAGELSGTSGSTGMYSFAGGIAEIPLALARDMADVIQTGAKVTSITKEGDNYIVAYLQNGREQRSVQAEAVILATPAPVARELGTNVLAKETLELLATVHYAPYVTVALFSDEPIFDQGFDLAVEDGLIFTDIYDATWVARHEKSGETLPSNSWVALAYLPSSSLADQSLIELSDQELLARIRTALDKVLPGASGKIRGHEVTRFRFGLPVMTVGAHQRMMRLDQLAGDGVFLAGDYLIYPTFEAAAASGQLAAERVIDWMGQ